MISVICVAYNAEKYIIEAIDSVLNQTFKDFEIIIIDDGSTDSTCTLLNKYEKYQNIRIIKKGHTGNPGRLRNEAIRVSKYELIAFIDADDIWTPEKLEKQFKYIDKYFLICTNGERIYENNKFFEVTTSSLFDVLLDRKNARIPKIFFDYFQGDKDISFEMMLSMNYIVTSSVLMHKKIIEEAGYFEEKYGKRGEDYLLWLCVAKQYKIKFMNELLTKYRIHENNLSLQNYDEQLQILTRTVDIRAVYLNDENESIRRAAKKGCRFILINLRKITAFNRDYDLALKYSYSLLKFSDNKFSTEYCKYLLVLFCILLLKIMLGDRYKRIN